ncbi:MAG: tetratricopeptide repeat protein [Chloroflexi bacterium]|nr:tetratricopeptide repeat protein [Chloroflexota bacterium]
MSDLLPDWYDDWIMPERERLLRLYLDTLLQLTQQARSESQYTRAIQLAQKILASDPANEQAHQHLIFCHLATGNRLAARKQYEDCRRALRAELDVAPSPETTALYERSLAQADAPERDALFTNLPIPLTSFVGRQHEIAQVKALLETARLLTLTGAGGCGKTRLAIQSATQLAAQDRFKGGVWWVDLGALSNPGLVTQSVAMVFDLSESPGMPLLAVLTNYLRTRELLLVIDNCEHLLGACAQLISVLLSVCPKLKILATSREALNIGGETVWRVPSLALPDLAPVPPLAQLRQFDAIQLFVERATAVSANWRLVENAAPAAQVCARLDGIPLAIELATARLKVLSAEQIAARLDDRFNLLTGGNRAALPRHQTLRATMDWSYDLLSDAERALLRRLSVFAGGFSLEAVEGVVKGSGDRGQRSEINQLIPDPRPLTPVLDLLTALIDKSLVVVETRGNATRYRLLETVWQYAREKLREANESEIYARRHRDWFLQCAEQADPKVRSREQLEWCERLERDMENFRAALTWSLEQNDDANAESALRLAGALWWFWMIRGYASEAQTWLKRALENHANIPARAKALLGLGIMEYARQGVPERCLALLDESLALYRQQRDDWSIALAASFCGAAQSDQLRANALFDEARSIAEELKDEWLVAGTDIRQGLFANHRGELALARALNESALYHARQSGDRWLIGVALSNLGSVELELGNIDRAELLFTEGLEFYRELSNKRSMSNVIYGLGQIALRRHNSQQAKTFFKQALTLRCETGHTRGVLECLWAFGAVAAAEERSERAARLLGAAAALREMLNTGDLPAYERDMSAVRAQSSDAAFDKAWAEGRALSLEQAVEYALENVKDA